MSWAVGVDLERERHIGYGVPANVLHDAATAGVGKPAIDGGAASRVVAGPPFDPTPDVKAWAEHVSSDGSWRQWRRENPEWLARLQAGIAEGIERAEASEDQS